MVDRIRTLLAEHGRLFVDPSSLADDDDLFNVGLGSHAAVSLMMALEDEFSVEFPDEMLQKATFSSISAIHSAMGQLGVQDPSCSR